MSFSLKQGLTWLIILISTATVIGLAVPSTKNSNVYAETSVATNWQVIKGNIGGSTYSEKDDDFDIGDNIHLNVRVTFDLNGGEKNDGIPSSKIVATNDEYGTLPLPTRPGYQFEGWYTKPINGIQIQERTYVKINHNHTLYAHWIANPYNIAYYDNDILLGTQDAIYTQEFTLKSDIDFNLTKRGYTFKGWKDANDIIYTSKTPVKNLTTEHNATVKLDAIWEANEYTINFDVNGGKNIEENSKIVTFDKEVGTMPTPVKQYYEFTGWYTSADGGEKYTEKTIYNIDSDITLYAHWDICYYTITFVVGDKRYVETVPQGTDINVPDTTKIGYTFTGWYTKKTGGEFVDDFNYTTQTVYAQWTANKYKITFEPVGGTVKPSEKEVTYDSAYGELPIPTKTGYSFVEWRLPTGKVITKSDTVKILEDTEVTAVWTANKYTVNYYNGNKKIGTSIHTYDEDKNLTLADDLGAEKKGYHFIGWSKLAGSEDIAYLDGESVVNLSNGNNSNVNLYAVWEANTYFINYYFDGNLIGVSNHIYDETSKLTAVKNFDINKTGYTFSGWSMRDDFKGEILLDEQDVLNLTTKNNGIVNLYAYMTANVYKINYFNGENLVGSTNAVYDKEIMLKTYKELGISKIGYHFIGWSTDGSENVRYEDGASVISLTNTGVYNLYAVWEANPYKIEYYFNNTLLGSSEHVYDVPKRLTGSSEFDYEKEGYYFVGWATSKNGYMVHEDRAEVTKLTSKENGVVKLYMVFNAYEYTVTLDPNGGEVEPGEVKVTYDGTYANLPEATRTGYFFQGWYLNGKQVKNSSTVKITKDETFVAQWTKNHYTIHYMDRGNEVGISECAYDATIKLKNENELGISKSGYYLAGWSKWESAEGVIFENEAEVKNLSSKNGANVYIYAVWRAKTYKITFDATGGSVIPDNKMVTFNGAYGTLPTPTKRGYIFDGWYTDTKYETEVFTTTLYKTPSNSTLYAKWNAISYKINYYNGGELLGSSTHKYDEEKSLTTIKELNFNKTGYDFTGWGVKKDDVNVKYIDGQDVLNLAHINGSEINLYAILTGKQYTITYDTDGGTIKRNNNGILEDITSSTVIFGKNYGYTFDWNKRDLPTPDKTGYVFVGWYLNDELITGASVVNTAANHTLKARYVYSDAIEYTVNHYVAKESVQGDFEKIDTDKLKGTTNAEVKFVNLQRNYEGFNFYSAKINGGEFTNLDSATIEADGNLVIDLYYSRNKYTITTTAGTGISSTSITYNKDNNKDKELTLYHGSKVTLDAVAKDGYHFVTWISNSVLIPDSTNKNYNFNTPIGDVTLTAQAERNIFTVKYNANGGTGNMEDTVHTYGARNPLRLNSFTKTGYIFAGWHASRQRDGKTQWLYGDTTGAWINSNSWYEEGKQPEGYIKYVFGDGEPANITTLKHQDEITMYAIWAANKFIVKYDANGGTGNMEDTVHAYGAEIALRKNTFTLDGHNFAGWHASRQRDGKTQWLYGDTTGAWINSNSWYEEGKQPEGYIKYTFYDEEHANTTTLVNNDVITMYAQWKAITFTVKYNANGGVGTMMDTTHRFWFGDKLRKNTFIKGGYRFQGWHASRQRDGKTQWLYGDTTGAWINSNSWYEEGKQPEGYIKYTFYDEEPASSTTLKDNDVITMYAQWKAKEDIQYSVNIYTMDVDGKTYESYSSSTYYGETDSIITINKFILPLTGMSYSKAVLEDGSELTSTNTTIKADGSRVINIYYDRNKYTVTIKKTDGLSFVTNDVTEYYGKKVAVTATVEDGYKFRGWESSDSSAISNSDANPYNFIMPATDVTLTAKATATSYYIEYYKKTYDYKGNETGEVKIGSSKMFFDTDNKLENATVLGIDLPEDRTYLDYNYHFMGWDTDSDAQTVVYEDEQTVRNLTSVPNGVIKLYAVYSNLGQRIENKATSYNEYQINSIIATSSTVNPATTFGGTWERIMTDRVPVGYNANDTNFNSARKTGGSFDETISVSQMPSHNHSGTTSSNGLHNHSINISNVQMIVNINHVAGHHGWINTGHKGDHYALCGFGVAAAGSHSHTFTTGNTGGSGSHSNMQPYQGMYYWKKTSNTTKVTRWGIPIFTDDEFENSTNGVEPYDNAEKNAVTVKRIASDGTTGLSSKYMLKIETKVDGGGYPSPGSGGFAQQSFMAQTNKTYYFVFKAKIPEGYTLGHGYNSVLGGSWKWVTSNAGTGDWETYIMQVDTGTTTFYGPWAFGYIFIQEQVPDLTWYVAYANVFIKDTNISSTVKYDANGGVGTMASTVHPYKGGVKTSKNCFTKPGYVFDGWYASRQFGGKTQWLYANSDGSFNPTYSWYEEGKQPTGMVKYKLSNNEYFSDTITYNGDIVTLHAQWIKNT